MAEEGSAEIAEACSRKCGDVFLLCSIHINFLQDHRFNHPWPTRLNYIYIYTHTYIYIYEVAGYLLSMVDAPVYLVCWCLTRHLCKPLWRIVLQQCGKPWSLPVRCSKWQWHGWQTYMLCTYALKCVSRNMFFLVCIVTTCVIACSIVVGRHQKRQLTRRPSWNGLEGLPGHHVIFSCLHIYIYIQKIKAYMCASNARSEVVSICW